MNISKQINMKGVTLKGVWGDIPQDFARFQRTGTGQCWPARYPGKGGSNDDNAMTSRPTIPFIFSP